MTETSILVLDEGTTSTRAMLFGRDGALHGVAQEELDQYYPQSGRVEHDAGEIWAKTLKCAQAMVDRAGGAGNIAAIGITNQRETVVAWDNSTGEPLTRAIVWQDRRTTPFCAELKGAGHESLVRKKTGLLLDPYFSGTKMRWMLDNVVEVRDAAERGRLAFGTIESWLIWKLTGGNTHICDASNASRTLLIALDGAGWDNELCDLFGVPRAALPKIVDCAGQLASTAPDILGCSIPICGMAGDQQAATIGQGCLSPGDTKATYGTGAFVLGNTGKSVPRSENRMLATVLYQLDGERCYALEGAVFVAGSLIKYLRDTLGLIESAEETEELASSIPDNGGVVVVPALSGLGAPHWLPEARGIISGLGFDTGRAHIARASLESMAHQTRDLANAFAADDAAWTSLRIDGGMAQNSWMAQDIADLLGLPVTRPAFVETTALGAAMLAAVGCGWHASLAEAVLAMIGETQTFEPAMEDSVRSQRIARWDAALAKV
ncbi:Glycerol kinase [Aurantiacibacter atlanticus]|uniref:ATP:glycerol 3-phosphotransferase n=1 Tax=Aurantiacibacter atlanticus TaxID=1648404 RepID=A0A0H4VAL5_9SPHN|nr:glycerol kinase GlpK [Aurantiacibacter atlanticus]AKQ41500.1 Glycerol kinase [Aurantiacibacter atlanticus]MDF1833296.1 glycerol kinase GlpK [Alteraurantiacibacter sp. bin_em_oilr2.035]